jgi:hypothetical protein
MQIVAGFLCFDALVMFWGFKDAFTEETVMVKDTCFGILKRFCFFIADVTLHRISFIKI